MTEDPMDRLLDQARNEYNPPPVPPREEMWAAIQARKQDRRQPSPYRKIVWPLGIAALIALGFGLGRLSDDQKEKRGSTVAVLPTDPPTDQGPVSPAMASAALQHLSRTETFLTGFKLEAGARVPDQSLLSGARDLLSTTRLLLDSPDLKDLRMRQLLRELEVVLAQVAQLQADPSREDANLIVDELDKQGVLPRLRTSIPAGPAINIPGES